MPAPFILLAFSFPPYNRVGAYRWSKLAARLARFGHRVQVVTVKWPSAKDPGWFADLEHENVSVLRCPSLYPHRLRTAQLGQGFTQKARSGLFRVLDALAPAHDMASLWGYSLLPALRRLIDADPARRVLVATGAPFSTNYWAARLAAERPQCSLIQDFRDPWLLTREQLDESPWADRFRTAARSAACLVTVTPEMSALFQDLTHHPRVITVPNGVDLAAIRRHAKPHQRDYDFAYIGSLFAKRDGPFSRFVEWLRYAQRAGAPARTVMAGSFPNALRDECRDLIAGGLLELRPMLPQSEAFDLVARSKIALHFNTAGAPVQIATKLIEHAALRVPTLSLNYGGATEAFLRARRLGWSLRADSASLFEDIDRCRSSDPDFDFDVSEFDFDVTARRYSELIDAIASERKTSRMEAP